MRRFSPLLLLAVAGCTMAPAYQPPQTAVPPAFREQVDPEGWVPANPQDTAPRGAWWEGFGDPVLNDLVARSHAASPTLAAAAARYDAALAAARVDQGGLFPTISVGGSAARERISAGRPPVGGKAETYSVGAIGGALSYEIDLWGRIRGTLAASRAEAAASEADLYSARLSLDAAVADAYVRLRGLDAEDALLRRSALAFQRGYELTSTRHEGGIASGIDVNRARTQLANAKAEISAIANRRSATEHELAALTGALASDFRVLPAGGVPHMQNPRQTAPSELLQRRPDIAAAERRLFAANARIGVARAAFFPSLMLGLDGGFQAVSGPLLSTPNSYWGLGPLSAVATLFDGGARKARVRLSRAEYEEISADYRETVLVAFREVEDALSARRYLETQLRDQREAAAAANRTSDLAMQRYRDGASDYLDVVTAQTAALVADRAVLEIEAQQARAQIKLVRGLGGA